MEVIQDTVLQRFDRFKAMFVSSNLPCNVLLELIESYINADEESLAVQPTEVLDGQLSLY